MLLTRIMNGELAKGMDVLREIFEARRILRLSQPEPLQGRFAFFFEVGAYSKEWAFTLSGEVLSDLPNMPSYRRQADIFARQLEQRFRTFSPFAFLSKTGRPLRIVAEWPIEPLPNRAASCVRVRVTDMRDGLFAYVYVVITH